MGNWIFVFSLGVCSENSSQNPSPSHPFPSSLSPGEREEGKGSWGEGAFSCFVVTRSDMSDRVKTPVYVSFRGVPN